MADVGPGPFVQAAGGDGQGGSGCEFRPGPQRQRPLESERQRPLESEGDAAEDDVKKSAGCCEQKY